MGSLTFLDLYVSDEYMTDGVFLNNNTLGQRPFSAYYGPRCLFWEWYVLCTTSSASR